jgi:hypothetical protein
MTAADRLLRKLRRQVLLREILVLRGAGFAELRAHDAATDQLRQRLAVVAGKRPSCSAAAAVSGGA